jgi:hypothetical protein
VFTPCSGYVNTGRAAGLPKRGNHPKSFFSNIIRKALRDEDRFGMMKKEYVDFKIINYHYCPVNS